MSADAKTRTVLENLAPLLERAEPYDDWRRLEGIAASAARRVLACELAGRRTTTERETAAR